MAKKLLLSFIAAFGFSILNAQNISYQVEIYQLGWDASPNDQAGGAPEFGYHVFARDNINGTESGGQCFYTGDNYGPGNSFGSVTTVPGGSLFGTAVGIRNSTNVAGTTNTVLIRFEAYEKDCSNNCVYENSCNLGLTSDDNYSACNTYSVNFRTAPTCVWTDYPVQKCGAFYYGIRVRWWYTTITGGSIGADQSYCGSGDPTLLTDNVGATGAPGTTYQWQLSTDGGVTYTDVLGITTPSYDPPVVTTTTYFRRKATACISGATAFSNSAVITISSPLTTPPISADQSFCGTFDPVLIGGPASTGTACIVYTWEQSTDGVIWGTAAGGSAVLTYDPPIQSGVTKFFRRKADISCGTGNPAGCASYSNIVTVTSVTPIGNNTISANQNLCGFGDPVALIGSIPTGGNVILYQWQSSPDGIGSWTDIFGATNQGYDPPPTGTDIYYRRVLTSAPCSSISNVVSIIVTPPLANNVVTGNSYQRFCKSGDPGIITASLPTGGTGTYTYLWEYSTNNGATWFSAPGANALQDYDPPVTSTLGTTLFRRRVTSGVCSLDMTTYAQVLILSLPQVTAVSSTNVSCFGGNDGTITVTATSSNGNVQYSIDSGLSYQTTGGFPTVSAGSYNVVVQDDSLCTAPYINNPVKITEPPLLTLSTVKQDASCANVFDGKITATAGGGTLNYSYSLNGGPSQTSNVFSGLISGNYTVVVTDGKGCTATSLDTIGNTYIISATLDSSKNVSCFGSSDGAIYVSLTGGVAPYEYSIDGFIFQSASSFTGLTAGNYTITLRDSKGCTAFVPVTIKQPAQISVTLDSIQNVLCAGTGTASIFITPQGGTPGYTYLWTDLAGTTTQDLIGVSAGTYNVVVTDTNGCKGTTGATVTQPLPLFVTLAQSNNVFCKGDSSGNVDITVSGGVPKYSFVWNTSPSDTLEDLANLAGGTYSVTVTDANGCQKFLTQVITEPAAALSVVLTKTDVSCNGGTDGDATATANGGTGPYTYLWSNNGTTPTISGLSAGAYFVTVKDANGCVVIQSITLGQPSPFVVSGTVTNVDCKGKSTGSINVTVNPVGTYSYAWSSPSATGSNPTGLAAGAYTVTVNLTSNPGCTVANTFTIAEPTSALALNIAGFDSVKCAGVNSGYIDITATGGTPSYTYNWTNGGAPFATSEDIANLAAGTYAVTVTDSKNCTATIGAVVNNPQPITSSIVKTDLKCNGDKNGSITLTVNGGTTPYSYLWSTFQGSKDLTQLDGGLYFVVITDAAGCTKRDSANIIEPAPLKLTTVDSNVSCNNLNDGKIDLTVTGGTPNYSFKWSNGPTTEDLSNLSQGTYAVTVTDFNLCTATTSVLIVNPPTINLLLVVTNPLCNIVNGSNNGGNINLGVGGGTPGFTYAWSNNKNTQNITSLVGGTYIVTVTDTRGCKAVDSAKIVEPDPIIYNVFTKNVSCKDKSDGFLDITAYGGTVPYSFVWSNGNLTEDVGGLPGGQYTVDITDKNGCTVQGFFVVKEPDTLKVSLSKTDATCQGANSGKVAAAVVGGTRQYNYLWNNFSFDSVQNNIPAGTYSVVVTDSNLCQVSASIVVNGQPSPMSVTTSLNDPKCFGASNGFVALDVLGGAQPYTYNWSTTPAQNGNVATALPSGVYVVTITDASGCSRIDTNTLVDPAKIVVTSSPVDPASCFNTKDAAVLVSVTGGKAPFVYEYNGFAQSSDTFRGIGPGTYSILVRDANGCEATGLSTVVTLSQLTVDLTADKEVILAHQPVQLTAVGKCDTATVITKYIWGPIGAGYDFSGCNDSTFCTTPLARPTQTTTLIVTVMDARGCVASDSVRIEVSNDKSQFIPTAFTPNADGLNDFFEFDILGAVSFDINVWNRWGEKVFSNPAQKNGITQSGANGAWDGTFRGKKVQFDTYTYQIVIKYFDDTTEKQAGTVTIMQ